MTLTTLPEHLRPMVRKVVGRPDCPCEICEAQRDEAEETFLRILNACLEGGVARTGTLEFGGAKYSFDGKQHDALIIRMGDKA